jgi:hypothetical protein
MKYLITYCILSYPCLGILIWIRFKEFKEGLKKAMGSEAMARAGFGIAKGMFDKSGLKKKMISPGFIILVSVVVIVATPFVFPLLMLDEIGDLFKKLIKLIKPKPPKLRYRAKEAAHNIWMIEHWEKGKWKTLESTFTDEKTIKMEVAALNDGGDWNVLNTQTGEVSVL